MLFVISGGMRSFFRYCYLHFAKNVQHRRPEDSMLRAPRLSPGQMVPNNNDSGGLEDEIEYITDYSWRNFFSAITFVKIMQKLTKGRSHRIGMLVNYKSSVGALFTSPIVVLIFKLRG
jgi:Domain of unknown function (DUF3402)